MELTLSLNDLASLLHKDDTQLRFAIKSMYDSLTSMNALHTELYAALVQPEGSVDDLRIVVGDVDYHNQGSIDHLDIVVGSVSDLQPVEKNTCSTALADLTEGCMLNSTAPEHENQDEGVTVDTTANGGIAVIMGKEKFFIPPKVLSSAVTRHKLSRETIIIETENMALWYLGKGIHRASWVATWQQWMARTAKRASTVPLTSEETAALPYNHPRRGRVAVL